MSYDKSVPRLLQARQPITEAEMERWRAQQVGGGHDFAQRPEGTWEEGSWKTAQEIEEARAREDDLHPAGSGAQGHKGDRRTQVEAPKPNEEREVGDLERAEREGHGRAHGER